MVVAGQNHALAFGNRNPTAGLQSLGGFVNKHRFVGEVADVAVAGAHQRARYHLHRFQQILGDVALQIIGLLEQHPRLLLQHPALLLLLVAKVADVFAGGFAVLVGGLAHRAHLVVALVVHHLGIQSVL